MKFLTSPHKTKNYKGLFDKTEQTYVVMNDQLLRELKDLAFDVQFNLQDKTATDGGTCVLGAGIQIKVFEPRKKSPSYKMFIRAPFQGNTGSYTALKPCLEFLKANYPQLHPRWEDGSMD